MFLLLLLLYEILYILDNTLEIGKFTVKHPFGKVSSHKVFGTILGFALLVILYLVGTRIFELNGLLFGLFVFISVPLYINYKVATHRNIAEKRKSRQALDELNTGDIILFETPNKIDNYSVLAGALTIDICHVGIIVRENGKLYLLDTDVNDYYCEYSRRIKNGVLLTDLLKRIEEYDDYYIIQTNLHKYIKREDLFVFIDNYSDKTYMEDGIHCMTFVLLFLHELKFTAENLVKKHPLIPNYRLLFDKHNYSIPFEYDFWKLEL